MLIEIRIKIEHDNDSMFNSHQDNYRIAHLLNKMALVQSQRNRIVCTERLERTHTAGSFHLNLKL